MNHALIARTLVALAIVIALVVSIIFALQGNWLPAIWTAIIWHGFSNNVAWAK